MQLPGAGTIYLEQDSKFLRPAYIGDTVTAVVEIEEVMKPDKGILKLRTTVYNQCNDLMITGYAIVKAPER